MKRNQVSSIWNQKNMAWAQEGNSSKLAIKGLELPPKHDYKYLTSLLPSPFHYHLKQNKARQKAMGAEFPRASWMASSQGQPCLIKTV